MVKFPANTTFACYQFQQINTQNASKILMTNMTHGHPLAKAAFVIYYIPLLIIAIYLPTGFQVNTFYSSGVMY